MRWTEADIRQATGRHEADDAGMWQACGRHAADDAGMRQAMKQMRQAWGRHTRQA